MATAVAASLGVDGGWRGCQLRPRKPYRHHSHSKGSSASNSSLRLVASSPPIVKASLAPSTYYPFPLKQALTAASLALAGDTIAQVTQRWRNNQQLHLRGGGDDGGNKNAADNDDGRDSRPGTFSGHDWLRALRMLSYGFLFYGPGSYAWYQFLDRCLPNPTLKNLLLKVLLNQIILGPCVIAVVFAWNNLWQGRLSQLPEKYRKDAFPTLLYGFRFWIPVSILNFWVVPLQARVAFMSMGSIFWNFYLSSTMSK